MLRDFLAGNTDIDPAKLAGAAGLPNDPELVQQLIAPAAARAAEQRRRHQLGARLRAGEGHRGRGTVVSLPAERSQLEQALHVAALWLDEATVGPSSRRAPRS